MKRRAFTLIEMLVVVAIVVVLAAVLFPVFGRARESCGPRHNCSSNLKQIGLGFLQYAQDYNETFPAVAISNAPRRVNANGHVISAPFGWADALYPYTKSHSILQCHKEKTPGQTDPSKAEYTDYWMNARLSSLSLAQISNPAKIIFSGDGNTGRGGTNARYSKTNLPAAWLQDTTSPAFRHTESMNILFADGHVKALKPRKGHSFASR